MLKSQSRGLFQFVFVPIVLLSIFLILIYLTSIESRSLHIDAWLIAIISPIIQSPLLYSTFSSISVLGSSEFILITIITLAVILFSQKRIQLLVMMLFINVGGILLNFSLKLLLVRDRPTSEHSIEIFNHPLSIVSYSFPSGHTMRITILALFMGYLVIKYMRKDMKSHVILFLLLGLVLGISLSRIIIGAHYPTDIIAAICVSVVWFLWSLRIMKTNTFKKFFS